MKTKQMAEIQTTILHPNNTFPVIITHPLHHHLPFSPETKAPARSTISFLANFPIIRALFKLTISGGRATCWFVGKHKRGKHSVWNCNRNYRHNHNVSLWHGGANNSKLFRRFGVARKCASACLFYARDCRNAGLWDCHKRKYEWFVL